MFDNTSDANKAVATRFIEVFNTDAWDLLPELVAPDFVLHHPMGGTMQLGPEGMAKVWSHFKAALPDSFHPIPVLITDGDYLANLLPTYGTFDGQPHQGIPPTGRWLEYGMVNMVRFEDGKIAEGWFGMDPLVELQQMGAAPTMPEREPTAFEQDNMDLYRTTFDQTDADLDTLAAFGEVVVALGPPQSARDANTRWLDIYRVTNGRLNHMYSNEFPTNPPHGGNPTADTELSRLVVKRLFEEVLAGHHLEMLSEIVSPDVLVHPTAMPCEATFYGPLAVGRWLGEQWEAFPDLTLIEAHTIAQGDIVVTRWTARGTSKGNFMMLPPTGEMVEFTGLSMYRIEDGLIAEIWDTRNTLGIMKQLNPNLGGDHHH
jgi:predicted ester cyclase